MSIDAAQHLVLSVPDGRLVPITLLIWDCLIWDGPKVTLPIAYLRCPSLTLSANRFSSLARWTAALRLDTSSLR